MVVMLITLKKKLDQPQSLPFFGKYVYLYLPPPPSQKRKILPKFLFTMLNIGLPTWSLLSHGGKIKLRNSLTIFSIVAIPVVSVGVVVILCPEFQLVKPYLYFATPLLKF